MSRPKNMSQLDYLWTYFGKYQVSEVVGDTPDPSKIVTESALVDFLKKYSGEGGLVKLQLLDNPTDSTKMNLVGISATGDQITMVELEKEDYLSNVGITTSSQEQVDKGESSYLGEPLLTFTMKSGKNYYISLPQYSFTGSENNSIKTSVENGVISTTIKIDTTDENNLLTETTNGLVATLYWEE